MFAPESWKEEVCPSWYSRLPRSTRVFEPFWHIFNWSIQRVDTCLLFRFPSSPPDILQRWWQGQQLRGVQVAIQRIVEGRFPADGSLRGWEVRWHETEDSFESWSDHERHSKNYLAIWDWGVTTLHCSPYGIFMILDCQLYLQEQLVSCNKNKEENEGHKSCNDNEDPAKEPRVWTAAVHAVPGRTPIGHLKDTLFSFLVPFVLPSLLSLSSSSSSSLWSPCTSAGILLGGSESHPCQTKVLMLWAHLRV